MNRMLSSWKEIAQFFGKGVRTVQRWEKTLDLPIRRPPGAPSNVVLARTSDLEEWMHRGPGRRAESEMSTGIVESVGVDDAVDELEEAAHAMFARLGHATDHAEPEGPAGADVASRIRLVASYLRDTRHEESRGEVQPLRRVA